MNTDAVINLRARTPVLPRFPATTPPADLAATRDRLSAERLRRELSRRLNVGDGPTYTARHHLWKLREVAFVSVGNEAYNALQTELRAVAGAMPLFVITLANENHGYLVPAPLHAEDHYASKVSPFAPGTFEKTVAALKEAVAASNSEFQKNRSGGIIG